MRIKLLFFAAHRRAAGTSEATFDLPDHATVREAAALAAAQFKLELKGSMVAVNDAYADPERTLHPDDTLAFIPPVSGGSSSDEDHFVVTDNALDITALHSRLLHPSWGGQAFFTGSTRTPNKNLEILRLEYEAYPALCHTVMVQLALEARTRFEVTRVVLAHRIGTVLPPKSASSSALPVRIAARASTCSSAPRRRT
ncbi:MAG: molybdopterin converting factor subunit 1 [Pleurocapsa sp. SU_196_0]|nr:molybdopterin converting factor subunit 1 [Pleurocapsa sp. SU_196_0]